MADISQIAGADIQTGPTGDLLPVTGGLLGQQRIIRRLYTNPGEYIYHPDYGSGLPSFIGQPMSVGRLRGIVQQQLLLEEGVAQAPPPTCDVSYYPDGTFNVLIRYADALTGQGLTLQFDITK